MTAYKIKPSGVEKVLRATVKESEDLGLALKPLGGTLSEAVTAAGGSGAITAALTGLMTEHSGRLKVIGRRTTAAVTGAYEATKAYNAGDHDMVLTSQRAAARAARAHR